VAPFASQVLADSVGPATLEAENVSVATCKSEDIVMSQASSASASSCSQKEREPDETARARAYLIATATPGYTMMRQGPEHAIARLHPAFIYRLAAAIAEARAAGLPLVGLSRPTGLPHSGSAGLSTNFTRFMPMGLRSTSPGSAHPARQTLGYGTRLPRGMA
jgi:hypothetical protein